jgi:hypothetical protein
MKPILCQVLLFNNYVTELCNMDLTHNINVPFECDFYQLLHSLVR